MILPIEKRLQLVGDVSNLMLMGSIHVYAAKRHRVHVTLHPAAKRRRISPADPHTPDRAHAA